MRACLCLFGRPLLRGVVVCGGLWRRTQSRSVPSLQRCVSTFVQLLVAWLWLALGSHCVLLTVIRARIQTAKRGVGWRQVLGKKQAHLLVAVVDVGGVCAGPQSARAGRFFSHGTVSG